jgi:hypothetical protein
VRYNAACAAALAGKWDSAAAQLRSLAALGALVAADAADDDDLAGLRDMTWFGELITGCHQDACLA